METRVLNRSGPKPNAAFPREQMMLQNLIAFGPLVSEQHVFMFGSVDARTRRRPDAFNSSELIINPTNEKETKDICNFISDAMKVR